MKRVGAVESALESAAAAAFGACAGYSAWLAAPMFAINPVPATLGSGALGFLATARAFQLWGRRPFPVQAFTVATIDGAELGELLLTDEVIVPPARKPVEELVLSLEQRLGVESAPAEDPAELLLEDVLQEIGPDSRVVRLFDPAAMLTAGELQSRIERHLGRQKMPADPDAAQALNDAITNLRRSLR